MQWRITIRVLLIQIGFFIYQCLYDRNFETNYGQMNWTAKDAAAHVDIRPKINQARCCFVVLLPNGKT